MEQQYSICKVAVAPLRAEAGDKSEIVSQLLFGDQVEVKERRDNWWLVQNAYDGYEGWMDFKQLAPISKEQYQNMQDCTMLAPLQINNVLRAADGSRHILSAGSNLPFYKDGHCFAGTEQLEAEFQPLDTRSLNFKEQITDTAKFFQNTSYLWGGRNIFGIDCSGYTQIVFKLFGVKIKRDASQQAEQGKLVDFLTEVQAGDLAFFDNAEGKITHVGIMLNPAEIIHASGQVRIDPIDGEGIFNAGLGRYTHKLRIIKRFV